MAYCKSCGVWVPNGQNFCSMCYGDPYYERDGYYLAELEKEERKASENRAWEEAMEEAAKGGKE